MNGNVQNSKNRFRNRMLEQTARVTKNDSIWRVHEERNYSKEEKDIFDTFHFLLGHLIVDQPTDPIRYLHQLLDDCILFRSGLKEPRLFWTKRHVDAIFQASSNTNCSELLSLNDFKTAMEIFGVNSHDPCPVQRVPGYVDRGTFCTEALKCMKKELRRVVEIGK